MDTANKSPAPAGATHSRIEQFRAAVRSAGLEPPEVIEPGKLHRFSTNGKASDDAGWCRLFIDMAGGVFGDFRLGLSETWQARRDKPFTATEREAFKQRCEAERREREAEQHQRHEAVARQVAKILGDAARNPAAHPYAVKKNVPFGPLVKRGAWFQRGWARCLAGSDLRR